MNSAPGRKIVQVEDRSMLAAFFRRDPLLHLYELGDLDPFFWPSCRWHGLFSATGALEAVVLEYACPLAPTVLALGREEDEALRILVAAIAASLPTRFYAHLTPGLAEVFGAQSRERCGLHRKMALADRSALDAVDVGEATWLDPSDLEEVRGFYERAYPENWFDARMLATGRYVGLREDQGLVAIAGVHVHSVELGVAALGNVATLPRRRGRGLARRVTAALCRRLIGEVEHVGLNVEATNDSAIACYRRLGFVDVANYEEWWIGTPSRSEGAGG
jgi:ribosomal protein S18 acetylase RimI-like enzyme